MLGVGDGASYLKYFAGTYTRLFGVLGFEIDSEELADGVASEVALEPEDDTLADEDIKAVELDDNALDIDDDVEAFKMSEPAGETGRLGAGAIVI